MIYDSVTGTHTVPRQDWWIGPLYVFIVIIDVDTRAIHRSCLRHRSIYSTLAGKLFVKSSAAKHMVS